MSRKIQIIGAVLCLVGLTGAALVTRDAGPPPAATELRLTVSGKFAFEPAFLRCPAGAAVHLRITHQMPTGGPDLPHTTVLLEHGTDLEAFGQAVLNARAEDNYVPASFRAQVLAATPLVHAGGQLTLNFQAPTQPGHYPLVCSFPGHCLLGMKATLIVD